MLYHFNFFVIFWSISCKIVSDFQKYFLCFNNSILEQLQYKTFEGKKLKRRNWRSKYKVPKIDISFDRNYNRTMLKSIALFRVLIIAFGMLAKCSISSDAPAVFRCDLLSDLRGPPDDSLTKWAIGSRSWSGTDRTLLWARCCTGGRFVSNRWVNQLLVSEERQWLVLWPSGFRV